MVETSPFRAGVAGSIPGWGAKIPHATWAKKSNIKQNQYCNKIQGSLLKLFLLKVFKKIKWRDLVKKKVVNHFLISLGKKFEKVLMLVGYSEKEKVMQFYFVQSIPPVLLDTYSEPDTLLSSGNIIVSKTDNH